MRFFEEHRRKAAEKKTREAIETRAQQAKAAGASYSVALSTWTAERDELAEFLQEARHWEGIDQSVTHVPLLLHKGEDPMLVLHGAGLIEPQRGPGHYEGGYSGFSFRVAKGVSYRIGGSRGTFRQGEETPTFIDTGTVTITNQRVVFQGAKQAREWAFAKMLGYEHDSHEPYTVVQVSNRQKVSGFLYDDANTALIRFRLGLATAMFNGSTAAFAADLERQVAEHDAAKPRPPAEKVELGDHLDRAPPTAI